MVLRAEGRARWAATHRGEVATVETPHWVLQQGRLQGHTAYEYRAVGRGPMDGLQVLWGQSPAALDHPTTRRFKLLIESKTLWRHHANGGDAATCARELLELITGELWTVRPADDQVRVRRVDVAVDHWGYAWSKRDLDRFACRQTARGIEEEHKPPPEPVEGDPDHVSEYRGATSATYYIGGRGSACRYLRIYDKIAESAVSGKAPWMEPLWRQNGWDGEATVWRAEIEHGGDWLKGHGLGTLEQLDGCEHALWLKYLEDVRHTTARATRLKRSATSPVWRCIERSVIEAADPKRGRPSTWTWHPRPPSSGGDMKVLTDIAAGCVRKLADTLFAGDLEKLAPFLAAAVERSKTRAQLRAQRQANARPIRPRAQPAPRPRTAVGA